MVAQRHTSLNARLRDLCILIGIMASAHAGQVKQHNPPSPLWSGDLVQGLTGSRNPGKPHVLDSTRAGVTFLDDNKLIAYEVDLDTRQLSSRESPDFSSTFRLDASVVDSTSGKLLLTKDWPTRPRDSSIQVATGGILLRTGGTLKILSKDFVELQEIPLKQTDPYEEYEIRISAGRKTILINHYIQNAQRKLYFSNFDVLDGETFKLTHNWTQRYPLRGDLYSISDTAVINSNSEKIFLSDFGGATWRGIWVVSDKGCGDGLPMMIRSNLFAYVCKRLSVVSTGGSVLMRGNFDKGYKVGYNAKVVTSQEGEAIAVSVEDFRDFWDTGGHLAGLEIELFSVSEGRRAFTVPISPLPTTDFDFALSPDGSKLAVLNDSKVSVYSLAPKK